MLRGAHRLAFVLVVVRHVECSGDVSTSRQQVLVVRPGSRSRPSAACGQQLFRLLRPPLPSADGQGWLRRRQEPLQGGAASREFLSQRQQHRHDGLLRHSHGQHLSDEPAQGQWDSREEESSVPNPVTQTQIEHLRFIALTFISLPHPIDPPTVQKYPFPPPLTSSSHQQRPVPPLLPLQLPAPKRG